jgi:hypothetical protein
MCDTTTDVIAVGGRWGVVEALERTGRQHPPVLHRNSIHGSQRPATEPAAPGTFGPFGR